MPLLVLVMVEAGQGLAYLAGFAALAVLVSAVAHALGVTQPRAAQTISIDSFGKSGLAVQLTA